MHNKKLLVLALSAAFAAPGAFAQKGGGKADAGAEPDSVVVLYGKLYPEIVRPSGEGATEAGTTGLSTFAGTPTGRTGIIRRNEMESSNSRFGVRGHEKLGGGMKAIFQLETEFHIDSNDSRFARRDSFVGLQHAWGTVKLGRMDTPFKGYGDDISFLGISSGNITSTSNLLRTVGFGDSSAASFHLRRQNALQYESPNFGPIDFAVMYSNNETDTATRKPHLWSAGIKWESGPFAVMLAHEMHWDLFGLSNNVPTAMRNTADQGVRSKDKATQVALKYKIGRHQFEFDANQKEYKENASLAGKVQSYKNNGYLFIWDARWSDQWRTQVHYIKATKGSCSRVNAVCSTDGLDGTQIAAGFAYYLSKKTYFFAMATLVRNGFSATYSNLSQQAPAVGEDISQYAAGINTSF